MSCAGHARAWGALWEGVDRSASADEGLLQRAATLHRSCVHAD